MVVVHLDGLDAEGLPAPAGVVMARVYASLEAGFTPSAGSYQGMVVGPGGRGSVPLGLAPGVWHVRVVWVGAAGQESAPSAPVVADLEPLVDADDIEQALAVAQERLEAVKAALGALSGPLTPMIAGVLPDTEGRVYYQKDEAGEIVSAWQVVNGAWVQQPLESAVLVRVTTDQLVAGMGLIGGVLIEEDAVTAKHITASESLTAKVAEFLKVKAGMIEANAIDGMTITGALLQTLTAARRGVKIVNDGLHAWDAAGNETVRVNGVDNLLTGRVQTNRPGEAGIILVPRTSTGSPGIWLSESGSALGGDAAIYMDANGNMNLRGKIGPNGAARIRVDGGLEATSGGVLVGGYGVFSDGSIEAKSMGGFGSMGSWGFSDSGLLTSRGALLNNNTNALGLLYNQGHVTTGSAANAFINSSSGLMARSTSARKYKADIQTAEVSDELLDLEVSTWVDKGEEAERQDLSNRMGPLTEQETLRLDELSAPGRQRNIGMIADDVADIDPRFTTFDPEGEVDGLAYDRLGVALFPITRRLRDRVSELAAENATLNDRLDRLEAQLGIPTV